MGHKTSTAEEIPGRRRRHSEAKKNPDRQASLCFLLSLVASEQAFVPISFLHGWLYFHHAYVMKSPVNPWRRESGECQGGLEHVEVPGGSEGKGGVNTPHPAYHTHASLSIPLLVIPFRVNSKYKCFSESWEPLEKVR
jgi:hypothetical protein